MIPMGKIEVRLYPDPRADKDVTLGIIKGVNLYFLENDFDPKYYLCDWSELSEIEERLLNRRDQVDIERYLDLLDVEKRAIVKGENSDDPHWDVVITSKDVCPSDISRWNFVWGGFYSLNDLGRFDLASLVASTFRLKSQDSKKGFVRGMLVGYHEVSHLEVEEHCEEIRCVYYHGLGGMRDLDVIVQLFLDTEQIPKCQIHQNR